ncbi:MAG: hypothetical protein CML31_09100 [Rhizobiales bacterium]|nr:hypothetical protein [Hoeflea sp.]MBG20102.1 hypothetical protein [Hyphomicrobiales bacterium]|tara:strand:+ start:64 stop:312 length:249 start_codon:yes stop_codon:yes gene_type:complete
MPDVFITALVLSFTLVRLIKGSWLRYPGHVAVSILGGMVGLILLMLVEPGSQNDWVSGNSAAAVGAWGAMALFDRISGGATS